MEANKNRFAMSLLLRAVLTSRNQRKDHRRDCLKRKERALSECSDRKMPYHTDCTAKSVLPGIQVIVNSIYFLATTFVCRSDIISVGMCLLLSALASGALQEIDFALRVHCSSSSLAAAA